MNPLIITAFTIGGAIVGYVLQTWASKGRAAELLRQRDFWRSHHDSMRDAYLKEFGDSAEAVIAHARASDALTTKNERIDRALECVTENSAHVGKKMAAILRGER